MIAQAAPLRYNGWLRRRHGKLRCRPAHVQSVEMQSVVKADDSFDGAITKTGGKFDTRHPADA